MVTAKDVYGVMAMMPSFSTDNAGDLDAASTVAVGNLQAGVDRMIQYPGPARTPIVKFSETTLERAKKKAESWKKLCDKYRPLVEAEKNTVKAAS